MHECHTTCSLPILRFQINSVYLLWVLLRWKRSTSVRFGCFLLLWHPGDTHHRYQYLMFGNVPTHHLQAQTNGGAWWWVNIFLAIHRMWCGRMGVGSGWRAHQRAIIYHYWFRCWGRNQNPAAAQWGPKPQEHVPTTMVAPTPEPYWPMTMMRSTFCFSSIICENSGAVCFGSREIIVNLYALTLGSRRAAWWRGFSAKAREMNCGVVSFALVTHHLSFNYTVKCVLEHGCSLSAHIRIYIIHKLEANNHNGWEGRTERWSSLGKLWVSNVGKNINVVIMHIYPHNISFAKHFYGLIEILQSGINGNYILSTQSRNCKRTGALQDNSACYQMRAKDDCSVIKNWNVKSLEIAFKKLLNNVPGRWIRTSIQ